MTENEVKSNPKSKLPKSPGPSSIPVALQFDQVPKVQKIKNSLVNSEQDIRVAIQKHLFFPKKFANCGCSKCGALNVIKESLAHPGIFGFQTDTKSRTATEPKRPDWRKTRVKQDSFESFTSLIGRRPYTSPALLEEPLIYHLEQKLASIFDKLDDLERKIDRNRKSKRRVKFVDRGSQCPTKDETDYHGVFFNCLYSEPILNSTSFKEPGVLEIDLKDINAGKECDQRFQELVQELSPTDSKEFKELLKEYQETYKNRDKFATTVSKIPVFKKKTRIRSPEEDSVTASSDDTTVTIGSFFDFLDKKEETVEPHQEMVDKLKTCNGTLEWLTKKLSAKKKKSVVAV